MIWVSDMALLDWSCDLRVENVIQFGICHDPVSCCEDLTIESVGSKSPSHLKR